MTYSSLPIIVIVGRPNVGKSSLFNYLTQSRAALVGHFAQLTRDRLYGEGILGAQSYTVVDTGGLIGNKEKGIDFLIEQQTRYAIEEADHILLVVDGRVGLSIADQRWASYLRSLNKKITLVINKSEGLDPIYLHSEFSLLGFDLASMAFISVARGEGIQALIEKVLVSSSSLLKDTQKLNEKNDKVPGVKVAIIGRPNVGKSTLLNRIVGEQRAITLDQPGTTRDSITSQVVHNGAHYRFVDTAGLRRRAKVGEGIEKFSVFKSLQAIETSQVVLLMVDAQVGLGDQELSLLKLIIDKGKAFVIAINKWDGLSAEQRKQVKKDLDRRLKFAQFAKILYISALHGTGVGNLFSLIQQAYGSATKVLSTSRLTRLLELAVKAHPPPLDPKGRRVKLRYAHPGGYNPPVILIHGQGTHFLPKSYRRYLENSYRKVLNIVGSPIRIKFRNKI